MFAALPKRLAEVRQAIAGSVDGYSPAQIIDGPVFAEVPQELRQLLAATIHQVYLEISVIPSAVNEVQHVLEKCEDIAAKIPITWAKPKPSAAWSALLEELTTAAECLRSKLDRLPDGVVLP